MLLSGHMLMLFHLFCVIVSVVLLWKGADIFVDAASFLARRLRISELIIGLTLVAAGTSAPEFAVSIDSALNGHGDISVGNVVGSNMFNLGFILGGVALICPVRTTKILVYRDGAVLILASLALALTLRDLHVTRIEGVLLLLLLVAYFVVLFRHRQIAVDEVITSPKEGHLGLEISKGLVGLLLVIGGAKVLVFGASHLARGFGFSQWAIAVSIVAAGTSAPEFVTALVAALKGRHGITVGGLVGSDIYNMLGVVGVASLIRPVTIDPIGLQSIAILCAAIMITVGFLRFGWRLKRWEAGVVVLLACCRLGIDIAGVSIVP